MNQSRSPQVGIIQTSIIYCRLVVNLFEDEITIVTHRLMTKNTQVYEAVAQECSRLTRSVVDRQNVERKLVLGGIKHTQCHHVHLTHRWRDLLETLTHERATWHFQHSYPRSDALHFFICVFG